MDGSGASEGTDREHPIDLLSESEAGTEEAAAQGEAEADDDLMEWDANDLMDMGLGLAWA